MKALASLSLLGLLLTSCGGKDSKDDQQTSPVVVKDDKLDSDISAKPEEEQEKEESKVVPKEEENRGDSREGRGGRGRGGNKKPKPAEDRILPDSMVGRGFETTTGNEMQHCLNGTISKSSAGSFSSSSFESILNFEDMASMVLKGGSVSVDTFFIELDRNHGFFKTEADTELTASYKFANVYVLGTKHIDNTTFAVDTVNKDLFRTKCGNKYISSALVGGVYGASVKLHFENEEVMKAVGSNFTFSGLATELAAAKLKLSEEQWTSVKVEVSTMQVGGGNVANPSLPAGAILRCDLSDLDDCAKVLKAIADYAQDGFRKATEVAPAILSAKVNPYAL